MSKGPILATISAALAFFSVSSEANANVQFYLGSPLPGSILETFDEMPLGGNNASFNMPGIGQLTLNNQADITQGTVTNVYAAPYLDSTQYVQVSPTNGSATFTLAQPSHYFGLEWGSVDTYNILTFYSGSTVIGTFTGADIIALAGLTPGDHGVNGTTYVNFTSSQADAITSIVATSTQIAFEFDNVRVSAAPLPASLSMFTAALLGMGFLSSRNRKKMASFA